MSGAPTPDRARIRLSRSVVGPEEVAAVTRVLLEDGYLGMGREVQAFEEELKRFLETEGEVICVGSGTAALHLGVAAVTRPGDEVLVQSLTYVSDFQAITAAGAEPVACEVDPATMAIDLKDAARRLTGRTRAIMPVHYAGHPGDRDALYAFAREHRLRVVEDAAHALGSTYRGRPVGAEGDLFCFSFDGIKNFTAGEGGAVVTADPQAAAWVRDTRLLAVARDTERRYAGERSWEFDVGHQGYRYHLSNLFAAIGRAQIRKFPEFRRRRRALARRYDERLGDLPDLAFFAFDREAMVPHIYPLRVLEGRRDGLRAFLVGQGVECGVHYFPHHRLRFFARPGVSLPVSDRLYEELLTLPLHPALTEAEQARVVELVTAFLTQEGAP